MNKIENKLGYLLLFVAFSIFIASCTKEVELPAADNISGTTIRYTVMVVSGGTTSLKSASGVENATVSLVMNDSIYSVQTDIHGIATFNNMASGIVAVSIYCEGFTAVNYLVDLNLPADSIIQISNILNASTMVTLFPLSGNETATISGQLIADLDIPTPGMEVVSVGVKLVSSPVPGQFISYINHSGIGEIVNIVYENIAVFTVSDNDGRFTLNVPASPSGIKTVICADEFEFDVNLFSGYTQNRILKLEPDTFTVYSGMSYSKIYLFQ